MQNNTLSNKNEQSINLVDLFVYLLSKWKWFVLSVLLFGGLAWYHYATSPLVFFRNVTVIIKDPSNKTSTAGLDRWPERSSPPATHTEHTKHTTAENDW